MNAVRNVAPVHRRTAKALRLSPLATIVTVLAPAAVPEILSGIRIGIAVTLLGILIAELFASSSGIGFALIRATDLHNVVDIFALTLLLFLFAVAINTLLHISSERGASRRRLERPAFMKSSQDRILTTHVGSLPRDEAVLKFLEEREKPARLRRGRIRSSARHGRCSTS